MDHGVYVVYMKAPALLKIKNWTLWYLKHIIGVTHFTLSIFNTNVTEVYLYWWVLS